INNEKRKFLPNSQEITFKITLQRNSYWFELSHSNFHLKIQKKEISIKIRRWLTSCNMRFTLNIQITLVQAALKVSEKFLLRVFEVFYKSIRENQTIQSSYLQNKQFQTLRRNKYKNFKLKVVKDATKKDSKHDGFKAKLGLDFYLLTEWDTMIKFIF
ncbi:hypothetical protein BpHYR1_047288, partial [Brachionus plicatilis]